MSTYWYYECLSHDPPLRADEEFTRHTDDELYRQGVTLAASRPLPDPTDLYLPPNEWDGPRAFLRAHPRCRLGLVNEYGERREAARR